MEMTTLSDLLDLQEVDLQIDRLLEERQSLPELDSYRAADARLKSIESDLSVADGELTRAEEELAASDAKLTTLEAKLGEHETRLFAGGMTARETEHMRLEVQSLRGQQEAMEERVLGMLEGLDPARERTARLGEQREKAVEEKGRLESSIREQWKTIDAEIARKEERKREALEPIEPSLLELYEKLRRIKEGVAVARLENSVCGGCHMVLSPAEHEEALRTDPPRCVHCRRILVP